MRAGGYTAHQSLTAEAAAVLNMSLGLARRRGHAQVTPLHVAFTLLSSSSSSSSCLPPHLFASSSSAAAAACTPSSYAFGILRRACVKSHPADAAACSPAAASHPLKCRALELCFNVALNRLPTTDVVMGGPQCSPLSSPSSSCASSASSTSFSASLIPHNPTLSNALVAALKRAQANQRRGCVELQNQLPLPPEPLTLTQQQPLLAIKVELDQLVVSILDDPSVSRVMREAGFSSPAVKTNIEEESAMLLGLAHHSSSSSSSHAVAVPPQIFNEQYIDFPAHANSGSGGGGSWPAQFLNQPGVGSSCMEDDIRAILEVMMRKQGRRTNPIVVGDSVSVAEASVAELMRRLDRGEVPDELRGSHVLRLNLPYVHARLMTRVDVNATVADLRRSVDAHAIAKVAGLIIYVGDIRWAVYEEDDALANFSPVAHMVAELARLLAELRAAARGCAWLVAAASYQTYMRCQQRRTSPLEATWALQPVVIPAGAGNGLALGPHSPPVPASSMKEVKINRLIGEIPLLDHAPGEEEDAPVLCAECASSFEREASPVRAKAEGTTLALTYFPGWPQADEPQASHKDELIELKRKWSRSCQRLHLPSNQPSLPSNASPIPWWRASAGLRLSFDAPRVHGTSKGNDQQDVQTALSLLLPDSLTTYEEAHRHRSEGRVQESGATICSGDAVISRQPWLGVSELPFGHLKRKTEGGLLPPGESKRRRHGGGLDLNLCPDEEEGGGDSEEEEPVPSDLTNECESNDDDAVRHDDDGLERHE